MNVLFVSSTRIGDAILSTGVLDHLLSQYPDARVTVACGPVAAPLFEAVPGLERLIVLNKRKYSLHWLSLWASTVTRVWDWVIDFRNAPLTYLIPAKQARHVGRDDRDEHRVRHFARMLGLADDPPAPRVWLADEHRVRARELLGDGPILALGPTANWRPKMWDADRFAELSHRLTQDDGPLADAKIAVFGGADEHHLAEPVLDALPFDRTIDLVGKVGLLDAAACLERVSLYVGNDSGLTHLSAAVGAPTLALFGPTKQHLYAPWGAHTGVADTGLAFQAHFPTGEEWMQPKSLMGPLTVGKAYAAATALYERCQGIDKGGEAA